MQTVTVRKELDHDAESVWCVLDDFGSVYKYNPGVRMSEIVGEKVTGLGAQRICHFYDGTSVKETVIRYTPDRGYSLSLSDFSLPLKRAAGHFTLMPLGAGKSVLSITLEFEPRFGPAGWLMAKLTMRPALKRALNGLTKGLEDHLETGRLVGEKGELLAA